jgi:DNA-binding transcriptional MerR regulator
MSTVRRFNLRAVTTLTGVNEHTLRAWERRYAVVRPARTDTGRRLYTEADVRRVGLVAQLVRRGHAISQLAPLADEALVALLDASFQREPRRLEEHGSAVARLEELVARYDLARLHEELTAQRASLGARAFALGIVVPLMGVVGRRVAAARFSIAQEHALSAIVRGHLTAGLFSASRREADAWRLAFTTVEGDQHELGALAGAVVAAHLGASVTYLGPSLPPAALAHAVVALRIDCVVLGGTDVPSSLLAWTPDVYVATLHGEARAARPGRRRAAAPEVEVWVGGSLTRAAFSSPVTRLATLAALDDALRERLCADAAALPPA